MISAKTCVILFVCVACALFALATADAPQDILAIDNQKCPNMLTEESCKGCCKDAGFNGYDAKRSLGCLCITFSGVSSGMTSLSDVMKLHQ